MILWLRERVRQCAKKNFQGCAQIYRQEEEVLGSFCRFFQNFFGIFCNFFGKFLQFFGKFLQFFGKFPQNFCNFFQPLRFPYDFSENSHSQSVTVQPGSRHYCKFTIKFTPKFTPILIKILQSAKFEGSHFYSFLSTFTAS